MSARALRLLVIDDDDLAIQSIRMSLPPQWTMTGRNSLAEVRTETFHAAFVDMHLSGDMNKTEGLHAIRELAALDPHLEIIAISGRLDRDIMEQSLRSGATRFLAKPLSKEEIQFVLNKIEALHLLQQASSRSGYDVAWVGASPASQEIRRKISLMRGEPGPILIEGESGAGKEIAARLVHLQEGERPFIQVNVASLPETLFESEVFGHVRGAFTGADSNKMGLAEAANGGDLFLDEIECLPLSMQPKLLRFLESGEIRRVGSKDNIRVKARVIAATNQNLEEMVREGKFREDLLWRLNGRKILLPPLRDRIGDIPDLAEHFLKMERPRRNKTLTPEALDALKSYRWPGNVRELRRVLEQVALTSPLPFIRDGDVRSALRPVAGAADAQEVDLSRGLDGLLGEFEKVILLQALGLKKEIDETARILGISRSSLYKKIKDHNIETAET